MIRSEFREAFASLPNDVRRQAQRAYWLFRTDPRHPSLRFKKVDEEKTEVVSWQYSVFSHAQHQRFASDVATTTQPGQ